MKWGVVKEILCGLRLGYRACLRGTLLLELMSGEISVMDIEREYTWQTSP